MSSVTKTGPAVYYAAWRSSALTTAIHYVFSVATIVWFLSMEPSQGPVLSTGGIDTNLPTSIDMAMSNTKLIEEVFKQGVARVINVFARTTGDCTDAERADMRKNTLKQQLTQLIVKQERLAANEAKIVEKARSQLGEYTKALNDEKTKEQKLEAESRAAPNSQKLTQQLETARTRRRALIGIQRDAEQKLNRDIAASHSSQQEITREARSAAFTLRSCYESKEARLEQQWAEKLREEHSLPVTPAGKAVGTSAKAPAAAQRGGKPAAKPQAKKPIPTAAKPQSKPSVGVKKPTTAAAKPQAKSSAAAKSQAKKPATANKALPTLPAGTPGSGVEKTMQEELADVEMVEKDISLGMKLFGCNSAFNPTSFSKIQEHINSMTSVVLNFVKPTTMIDMDRRMMAGEFAGKTFGSAPLQAPPNGTLAAVVLAPLRPIAYVVLGLMFVIYLAYTLVGIPFAWLMNGIRNEFFTKQGTEMPLWKSWAEQITLLIVQGTVAFWTIPLWFIFGGSIFWLGTLAVLTPLAFAALGQATTTPRHQILYYAAVSALPFSLLSLAFAGRSYLGSKLPEHSDVRTPATYAWWAWLVATMGLGISTMMRQGADESGSGWKTAAWVSLVLLVLLPPIAVLAEP